MKPWQKTVRYCAIGFAAILIVNIIGWAFSLLGWIFVSPETVISEESQSFEFSSDVKDLEIEIPAARLTIKADDCEVITVKSNLKNLTAKENGGRLRIKDPTKGKRQLDSAFVEVTYPSGTVFEKVDIDSGAGRFEIVSLSCASFDLDLGAGETVIDSLTVSEQADIDGGAGALTMKNVDICGIDLDMGVGALAFDGILRGRGDISLGVGEAVFALHGEKEGYTLDLEKGIGEITVDGSKVGNSKIGGGSDIVKIEGGVGSISINFADKDN